MGLIQIEDSSSQTLCTQHCHLKLLGWSVKGAQTPSADNDRCQLQFAVIISCYRKFGFQQQRVQFISDERHQEPLRPSSQTQACLQASFQTRQGFTRWVVSCCPAGMFQFRTGGSQVLPVASQLLRDVFTYKDTFGKMEAEKQTLNFLASCVMFFFVRFVILLQ